MGMFVHLPIPFRLALSLPKRQTAIYARTELATFDVVELTEHVTRHPFLTDAGMFESFEHHGVFYRPILDRGRPMSLDDMRNVAPSRLFFDWTSPATLALEDHPTSRNVTFEPDFAPKWPEDERPIGSGWSVSEATAIRYLDERLPDTYEPKLLPDYAVIDGQLVRRMEGKTVTLQSHKSQHNISGWSDIPKARVPFEAHFGQPHVYELRAQLIWLSHKERISGLSSLPAYGLASAEVADRRTLVSAVATMLARLNNIKFGRVPAEEIDIVWYCKAALLGPHDPAANAGLLQTLPGVLRRSPDAGLRKLGNALQFRLGVIGGSHAIEDEELSRGLSLDGQTSA